MVQVVGVRFRSSGKLYYFDPNGFEIRAGAHVIVETARGLEYGTVVGLPREIEDEKIQQPLKAVVRVASPEDEERAVLNRVREREAISICKEKIIARGLDMKLIDAEYTFDNSKVLFYFTADGRIDFRELVKDLASVFRTRIELRQIGVRDETKILGGIGICGRPLCCHSYLTDFTPVSIKMAKEQNLSLNPNKISGVCGRLMCCLKNEEETYEYLNSQLPNVGETVTTLTGLQGVVSSVNVLRQTVKIVVEENDEKEVQEYPVAELSGHGKKGKENREHKNHKKAENSQPQTGAETLEEGTAAGAEASQEQKKSRRRDKEFSREHNREHNREAGKEKSRRQRPERKEHPEASAGAEEQRAAGEGSTSEEGEKKNRSHRRYRPRGPRKSGDGEKA